MSVSAATRPYDMVAERFHKTLEQALREAGGTWPTLDGVDPRLQSIVDTPGPARHFAPLHDAYR
jgi:hypothetical protein